MVWKCRLVGLLLCCFFLFSANASKHKTENFDVVIYGTTPSGITAAMAAAREKAKVIVIGPEKQIGGMVTGGLCRTDFGDPTTVGGLAREYFQLCKKTGGADEWYNEPHVFQKAMSEWISGAGFKVQTSERLTRVEMKGRRIVSITTSNGNTYTAPVFIDASYEGDLMAKAGVSYLVGREPKETYGETFAGIQYAKPEEEILEKDLEDDCPCLGGKAEHYIHGTKMKIGASNADASLKKGISEIYPAEGTGDGKTQAYCFRLTVTQRADIRVFFPKPVNYNPDRYQILLGIIEKYPKIRFSRLVHFGKLPNGKFDMNSSGLQSIDFVGGNMDYPEGDYKTRDRIWQEHKNYQQGFLWFLAHDSRIPKSLQAEVNSWGLCSDEFTDNVHWPYQLYVREARRMTGAYVMTENDLLKNKRKEESIGLGSFLIDSHHVQYLKNGAGWIETEGTIAGNNGGVRPGTYEIPYSALIPKEEQYENLIVPVCLSASHVAYGSLRMEPVYMILGHASGLAAVMAKNSACPVQRINIQELQRRLAEQKQQIKIGDTTLNQEQKSFQKYPDFHPAQIWSDTNGKPINAHGGGVLFYEGVYYWYGEHKLAGKSEAQFADGGIHCYSSKDLINWKDEGVVLSVDYKDEKSDLAYGCILERPKVVYNEKNRQFVAYFKLYLKGVGYETSNVGVAVAEKPNGPFIYHHKFHGAGSPNGSGDFSMFRDDDGSLYHLTVRKPDKAFVIGKLDDDYYYPEGDYQVSKGIELHTEAPMVIKRNGLYHLLGSGSSGWKPNAARYYTTDQLLGNWTYHGNPCHGYNPIDSLGIEKTYGGQSSYILQVQGLEDAYIAMFDIWKPQNPVTGRYIWLPIEWMDGKMSVSWRDIWNLSDFKSRTLKAREKDKATQIRPGQLWNDSNNNPINAHGGGILYYRGIYYWYGTHKIEGLSEKTFADGGIHCYASNDLITWSDKGLVLSLVYNDDRHDLAYECNFDRPKVVYNAKTKKFVAFFKLYLKGQGVTTGYVGVALSDSPSGPFTYSHKFLGAGSPNGSGDYAMFQEENGDLYHLTVRKPDKAFVVGKMNEDYLLPVGEYIVCEGITEKTEAPAIVKRNGIYHLLGSGSSGWDPNAARYFTSKSLSGPWLSQGNPCEGVNPENGLGKEKTYGGQSTFILPVMGRKDACIAVFDINKPENPITGRYIWLPIEWKEGKMSVSWRDSWDLSVFEDRPEDIIAASQAGASPLFFDPASYTAPVIQAQNFSHPDEFKIRSGLPNFFSKVKKGKSVVIGYLGGSITRADNQYRLQSAKFIQNLFPQVKVTGINAGVSGTGSDLGACRLFDQLLQYHPDLIFVEFAVNGAFPDGVEGIIRQIWKSDPKIDICLIYTISSGQTKIYAEGKVPENIRRLENIADQYAIPSVHMGLQSGILEKEGKLIWKSDTTSTNNQIIFSADGTHPLEAGGNLYAEAIARAMLKMQNSAEDRVHQLGKPLITDNWEDAKMLDPKSCATFSSDWNTIDPSNIEQLRQFAGWFPTVMKAEKPGSWIKFRFNGTMLGIFDIGGPEVGQIELELDGKKMYFEGEGSVNFVAVDNESAPKVINRFNKYCNNRYRGQCLFIKTAPGDHTVTLKISAEIPDKIKILGDKQLEDITLNPMKYNRSVIYLGKILIRGNIIK